MLLALSVVSSVLASVPAVDSPSTTVVGGLTKEEISDVIHKHESEVRFCYELQLQQKPKLAGKVGVAFDIGATGEVVEAKVATDTLNDEAVVSCIVGRVKRWHFPKPIGGGVVHVTFPWTLMPAEAERETKGAATAVAPSADVTATGSLGKDVIRGVIHEHRPEIQGCYETALGNNPKLAGKVAVRFVIAKNGVVARSSVASESVGDERLTACVTDAVKGWQFPPPKGGGSVTVTYPFVFAQTNRGIGFTPAAPKSATH